MAKEPILKNLLDRVTHLDKPMLVALVRKLYRQKDFFEKILNVIQDGIIIVDADGRILLANTIAENMFNLRDVHDVALWKCIPEIFSQIDHASIMEHSVTAEVSLSYPSRRLIKFCSMPFADDQVKSAVCILTDITQSAQDKAQEIEQEKTDSILLLSSGIAHEIGNPLNSISLQLELMYSFIHEHNSQEISKAIDICKTEVDRLHGIIKNFLQAVRPVRPNFTDANLLELVNFVVKFLSPELVNEGVEVIFNITGEIPLILGDIDQLKQVFFNIIRNAMEAMTSKKQLQISLSSTDEEVIVIFQDTGDGIPAAKIGGIFDPFSTTKIHGTGLGMFIVQRILRDHGAKITIESREKIGTKITLKFLRKNRKFKRIAQSCSRKCAT